MDNLPNRESWLHFEHPDYPAHAARWQYVDDVYTGAYAEDGKLSTYLPTRTAGEAAEAYAERKALVDPDMLYPALINSLAGQVFAVETDILRTWQPAATDGGEDAEEGLGDSEDAGSIAARLWRDADGEGTNWAVFWRRYTTDLLRFQWMWAIVEGVGKDDKGRVVSQPCVKAVPPLAVTDWIEDPALGLVEVKVKHTAAEARDGVKAKGEAKPRWTVYTLDGWTRYKLDEKNEEVEEASGTYVWYDTAEEAKRGSTGRRCLPIFWVVLPLGQNVSYLLARKAVAAFNMESRRDYIINTANTPRLVLKAENGETKEGEIAGQVTRGQNFHVIGPNDDLDFIAPVVEASQIASGVIEEKRRALFVSGYRQYADEARQKTATEVRQDARGGVEAFLAFLSVAAEEAENRALFLLSQAEFPDRPELWGQATVKRSTDFAPVDAAAEADRMADTVFAGAPVPLGATGRKAAAMKYADAHMLEVDEAEVEAEVREAEGRRTLARAQEDAFEADAAAGVAIEAGLNGSAGGAA